MWNLRAGIAVLLSLAGVAAAREPDAAHAWADYLERAGATAAAERSLAVNAELAALGAHDWAGDYYAGDGLGVNMHLSLAPTAGVAAAWTGCLGLYASNEGIVQPQPDGSLRLVFHAPNSQAFGGFDEHLLPVRWGARRYLIPAERIEQFVSAINLGSEPRSGAHGVFLLAENGRDEPVSGLPDLPSALRAHIRGEPLQVHPRQATLVASDAQEGWCSRTWRIDFDVGNTDGLATHAELRVEAPHGYERVRIDRVGARRASGEFTQMGADCAKLARPDATWVFTTGAYRAQP